MDDYGLSSADGLDVATNISFFEIANIAVAFAIIVAGALSVIYIFVGGLSFIMSGGDDAKVKSAVQTIRYAIIGLVVTIFAVTIISVIGRLFNFELTRYIRWDIMSELIRDIVNRISSPGGTQPILPLNESGEAGGSLDSLN